MLVVSADIFVGWPQVIVEVMAHGFRWLGLAVEGFCIFFYKAFVLLYSETLLQLCCWTFVEGRREKRERGAVLSVIKDALERELCPAKIF